MKKSFVVLIISTMTLVVLGSVSLSEGMIFAGNIGTGTAENIETKEKIKKINTTNTTESIEIEPTYETSNGGTIIKKEPVDLKKQEELYQSVKDKINIQKETAKAIFEKKIYNLFGDSINISDNEIWLNNLYSSNLGKMNYVWWLSVDDKKNKKLYFCIQDSMTGECTKLSKLDYTGLKDANDSGLISAMASEISDDKLKLYIKKAGEIVDKNNTSSSKNGDIEKNSVEQKLYIGKRPVVGLNVIMKNGNQQQITFYTDTDELVSVDTSK